MCIFQYLWIAINTGVRVCGQNLLCRQLIKCTYQIVRVKFLENEVLYEQNL